MPGKPLRCKAFRASFTLSAAGYIAPADAAQRRDFALSERGLVAQTIAQADDVGLPPSKTVIHALAHLGAGVPEVQFFQHVVVYPHYVNER